MTWDCEHVWVEHEVTTVSSTGSRLHVLRCAGCHVEHHYAQRAKDLVRIQEIEKEVEDEHQGTQGETGAGSDPA